MTHIKSENHIAFHNNAEYIVVDDQLFKCPLDAPFDTENNRTGTWECSVKAAKTIPEVYPFWTIDTWQKSVYNAPVAHRGNPTLFRSPVTNTYVSID